MKPKSLILFISMLVLWQYRCLAFSAYPAHDNELFHSAMPVCEDTNRGQGGDGSRFTVIAKINDTGMAAPLHDTLRKKAFLGVYAGINNVYEPRNAGIANVSAYTMTGIIGACGNFELNDKLRLEAGFGFMWYGAKNMAYDEVQDTANYWHNTLEYAYYVTVPCLLKWRFSPHQYVMAGIRVSYLISYIMYSQYAYVMSATKEHIKGEGYFNYGYTMPLSYLDAGLMAGYEINPLRRCYVSLIYNCGLMPILTPQTLNEKYVQLYKHPATTLPGNYNNSLELRVCYNFFE